VPARYAIHEQEVIHSSGKVGAHGKGELLVTSEGRLRMVYSEPEGQTLIVDARNVWIVRDGTDAIVTTPLNREPLAQAVVLLLNADPAVLLEHFSVRQIAAPRGGSAPVVVSLVPVVATSAVAELLLVLEPSCPSLKRIIIIDRAGTAVRLTFDNVELDVKIPRGAFTVSHDRRHRHIIRP
jgi:outer membrane lipoprotein-sorting protein